MKDSYKNNISEGFALNDPLLQRPDGAGPPPIVNPQTGRVER